MAIVQGIRDFERESAERTENPRAGDSNSSPATRIFAGRDALLGCPSFFAQQKPNILTQHSPPWNLIPAHLGRLFALSRNSALEVGNEQALSNHR